MEPIKEIKEKLDIVDVVKDYIQLFPAGKNFKAICPFHKEKTPSFIISPDRQTWHCFGSCNEGGDVISFVMKYENLEFYEALKMLAERAGVELKSISPSGQKEFGILYDINLAALEFYRDQLLPHQEARVYLEERGIKKETIDDFEIGFAPTDKDALILYLVNRGYEIQDVERAGLCFKTERGTYMDRFRGRLMFPLYNTFGKVVGFSGRVLPQYDDGKSGKYVNSPETLIFNKSKTLYGFHKSKSYIKELKQVLFVEGQMDFLMLYQDGVKNVIATSGTALTNYHLEILKKVCDTAIFAFDSDEAGLSAIERAIDMAHTMDLNVKSFTLEDAKDPAEYIVKNPGQIDRLIRHNSLSAFDFYYRRLIEKNDSDNLKTKLRSFLSKILHIASPIERSSWVKKIAEKVGMAEKTIYEEMEMFKGVKKVNVADNKNLENKGNDLNSSMEQIKSRVQRIAMDIFILIMIDRQNVGLVNDYRNYFPQPFDDLLDFIVEDKKPTESSEADNIFSYLEMQASLKNDQIDQEKIPVEISFLLKELKREYLKDRKQELLSEIKKSEQDNNPDKIGELLKEFDEIVKLIDN